MIDPCDEANLVACKYDPGDSGPYVCFLLFKSFPLGHRRETMKPQQYWRAVYRGSAAVLLFAGLYYGYWWFYKLAPTRRTISPEWRASHSERAYWHEVQKGIHRGMWLHDDGFTVGWYGDKAWAEWIVNHVRRGEAMDCFGRLCHSASAMRCITNQDAGEDADAWLDWWTRNKSKSQEEWIADGFRQRGLEVDVPPSPDQTTALLGLLGESNTDSSAAMPGHLQYNAFRCLRDSGFDPVEYALGNQPLPADVERGLLRYAQLECLRPTGNGIGILSFGGTNDELESVNLPPMLRPEYQFVAYFAVFAPLLVGAGLLARSFRKRTFWPASAKKVPPGGLEPPTL